VEVTVEIGLTRAAYDDHGKRATYEEIEVGAPLGELEWVATPEMIEEQCRIDGDYDPAYGETAGAARIAPPQLTYRPVRWLLSHTYNVRGMFYRWKMQNFRPIRAGATLTIRAWIADKYVRNEREFVVYAAEGSDAGGLVFRTERTHVLDFIPRTAPRSGKGFTTSLNPEGL
jgi:acyl dehydratase